MVLPAWSFGQVNAYQGQTPLNSGADNAIPFEVHALNYNHLDSVRRYKKLELGIRIEGEILDNINSFLFSQKPKPSDINPFLEWEFDVNVQFVHKDSGTEKFVDGFYFQDYRRDTSPGVNDWIAVQTDFPVRVRFAPPLNGTWSARIRIELEDSVITFPEFDFHVLESGHPGVVGISKEGKNFVRGGEVFYPIGHNMAGPSGANIDAAGLDINSTNKASRVDDWLSMHEDIQNYIQQGGRHIKLLQQAYTCLIEFEKKGNYLNRLHYAWEQDHILDYCEENDVMILFDLFFQNPLMKYGQYGTWPWDFGHYNGEGVDIGSDNERTNDWIRSLFAPYCYFKEGKEPYEMFMDEQDLRYHEQRNRYYVSRYGYSPQVYCFELISEPWHLNELGGMEVAPAIDPSHPDHQKVLDALYNYQKRISSYIKNELKRTDILIGIQTFFNVATNQLSDKSPTIETIDIIGFNQYDIRPDKLVINRKGSDDNLGFVEGEQSFYKDIYSTLARTGKPVILSEAGHDYSSPAFGGVPSHLGTSFNGHFVDVTTLPFTGIAGVYMYSGFAHEPGRFDERTLWPNTIQSQEFMNSDVLVNVFCSGGKNWKQGRQTTKKRSSNNNSDLREMQYYLSEDSNYSAGYIRNKTYNYYTKWLHEEYHESDMIQHMTEVSELKDVDWNDHAEKLEVHGLLPRTTYELRYFNAQLPLDSNYNMQIVKSDKKGVVTLKHPTLWVRASKINAKEDRVESPLLWFTLSVSSEGNERSTGID
jgi:hypothetical protein